MSATAFLQKIVASQHRGKAAGMPSICSANRFVLRAAMMQAKADGTPVCVESTSNQVNQFGGYTGMTARDFASYVAGIAREVGFPAGRILLGGDHLGPNAWQKEPAAAAMPKALELVHSCVRAGYAKIHLDASMRCADDPSPLAEETITQRAADMCAAAEEAYARSSKGNPAPLYIIGTEVPIPGGEQEVQTGVAVTRPVDAQRTISMSRQAFVARGLHAAWKRVVGVVVQPGVEFSDTHVFGYNRKNARPLTKMIRKYPGLIFEAHSTDYQTPEALRELVEDHFAILKVGPWLTFAFREAIFALASIEQELLSGTGKAKLSRVPEVLEEVMLASPGYWKPYYHGDAAAQRLARRHSFSDRSRYYWPNPKLESAIGRLLANLRKSGIPLSLLSQYLPRQYDQVRRGKLSSDPDELILSRIMEVTAIYARACLAD